MTCIHLATALVRRDDMILLVASRYPNHERPLWNMPGGRQEPGELLTQTVLRELNEETGMHGVARELCYISESYDGEMHFTNFTFAVEAGGEPELSRAQNDHVVDACWVPLTEIAERITVAVVREPLLAFLHGSSAGARPPAARYAGYPEAGISIEFPE